MGQGKNGPIKICLPQILLGPFLNTSIPIYLPVPAQYSLSNYI